MVVAGVGTAFSNSCYRMEPFWSSRLCAAMVRIAYDSGLINLPQRAVSVAGGCANAGNHSRYAERLAIVESTAGLRVPGPRAEVNC
jgi:hypothetical protein